MAPSPLSQLSKSAQRSTRKALEALEAKSPDELVELARRLWEEAAQKGPSRKGLQSRPARVAAWLDGSTVRFLGIHAYLATGELPPLVGALRQAVDLEHAESTAGWIASRAHDERVIEELPPRVPFLDGSKLTEPPSLTPCLRALATGDRRRIEAVFPKSLEPRSETGPYAVAASSMLACLHPSEVDGDAVVATGEACLKRKLRPFDEAMLRCLLAILKDDPPAFGAALARATETQAKTGGLHTPFGPASYVTRAVAVATFGFPVLAALRYGPEWISGELPGQPRWPSGVLEALLDPAPTRFVTFGIAELDAPEGIPMAERAAWADRI